MSKFIPFLVLAVFLCVPAFVKADPVIVINFDDPSPAPLQTYISQGVEFSTILLQPTGSGCPRFDAQCTVVGTINNIALRTSPAAVSPPQGAFPVTIDPSSGNLNGILIRFVFDQAPGVAPGSPFTWSLNVIGSQGGQWHILVFNESSTNIFDLTTGLTSHILGTTDRSFAATMDFAQTHHIIFIPSSQNGPEGIDNFTFTATAVPEPTSMLLLSLGIGGLFGLKGRRRFLQKC
jgi:hypothetical protein